MTDEYLNAPKLLVVTWDHTPYDDVLLDLTPLLQLRAHCSTFTVKFMPDVMRDDWITDEECYACGHNLTDDCDSCCCDMHEEIMEERIGDILVAYSYTRALNDFFANSNAEWLQDLRENEGEIIVECAVDCEGFELPSPTICMCATLRKVCFLYTLTACTNLQSFALALVSGHISSIKRTCIEVHSGFLRTRVCWMENAVIGSTLLLAEPPEKSRGVMRAVDLLSRCTNRFISAVTLPWIST